ncbi:MAG: SH3 domain-containing protein [Lachnospiraceae bacterium]|nr:SH3 domain-containing protein [Lachnospiraceae bacterium]
MSTIIGSARVDEDGTYSGGMSGDQLQTAVSDFSGEVSMQEFYVHKKGWYVLRPKTAAIAEGIAEAMKQACNNPNLGYDQGNRLGVVTYGTGTTKKTECDCSSLVRQCVKEASGKDPGNFTTAGEADALEATGLFHERVAYTAGMTLYTGSVLVTKTKGHTVVVTDGRTNAMPVTTRIETAKSYDKSIAGAYKITANLNLRAGAGTEKASLVVMPKGTEVRNYGYYTTAGGKKWYYVVAKINGATHTGFCSSAYLKK